jgi:hypothetical protein
MFRATRSLCWFERAVGIDFVVESAQELGTASRR